MHITKTIEDIVISLDRVGHSANIDYILKSAFHASLNTGAYFVMRGSGIMSRWYRRQMAMKFSYLKLYKTYLRPIILSNRFYF